MLRSSCLKFLLAGACASFIVLLFAGSFSMAQEEAPEKTVSDKAPVTLDIEPGKRIFSSREGLVVTFTLKAQERTKVCLERDVLSQMTLQVSRSGEPLPLAPLVVKDNRHLFHEQMKIRWLEPGESLSLRANIKRLNFANGERWVPGEYNITGAFSLCEQTPDKFYDPAGKEMPVRSRNAGWFMIMS